MRSKLSKCIAVTAMVAGSIALSAGGASAAHCVDPDTGDSPGFSYFGNDHVQEEDSGHTNEGKGTHMGNPGASSCIETGNPSKRAPGKA